VEEKVLMHEDLPEDVGLNLLQLLGGGIGVSSAQRDGNGGGSFELDGVLNGHEDRLLSSGQIHLAPDDDDGGPESWLAENTSPFNSSGGIAATTAQAGTVHSRAASCSAVPSYTSQASPVTLVRNMSRLRLVSASGSGDQSPPGPGASSSQLAVTVSNSPSMLSRKQSGLEVLTNLLPATDAVLATADDWKFDAFKLADATGGYPLSALAFWLFQRSGLVDSLRLDASALARFLRRIEDAYADHPYHCRTHAADVLQVSLGAGFMRRVLPCLGKRS
jgi:hypothetical protein